MQDTLLRVFVVAVGLLTCPRDDHGVQELDDITSLSMQKSEQRLMGGGNKLDSLIEAFNEEMTHTDHRGPSDDKQTIPPIENRSIEEKQVSNFEDLTQKTLQIEHEQKEDSQLFMQSKQREDFQTDGALSRAENQEQIRHEDEISLKEQDSALTDHTMMPENETSEAEIADWEKDYLWYLWNTLSIISVIRFFRKYLGRNSQMKQEGTVSPVICTDAEMPLLDRNTLQRFHSKCVKVSADNKWKEEFLEGFADDLIEAMRKVCDKSGMVLEDCQMLNVWNIIVPFTPHDPCSFQCLFQNHQASDLLPDMQVCGQIKLVGRKVIQDGCPCQSPDADDMVCLLHCQTEKSKLKISDVYDGPLCVKNTPLLSKSQVTRWFQSTIKEAWAQISHKYEFELNIRYLDAAGALVIRFRSGKKISFNMNPVVRFNAKAHFFITPGSTADFDTLWTLSLTKYENYLLEKISKHLPENSCHTQTLEVAVFLHRRQTALSGSSSLRDFHFKIALMHLLMTSEPSQWKPDHVAYRVKDLLAFMGRSLEKKQLHHVLIGNRLAAKFIELPVEFTVTQAVNLFYPLVVHNCMYRNAVMHFKEMLKNAHMLIQDYVSQISN